MLINIQTFFFTYWENTRFFYMTFIMYNIVNMQIDLIYFGWFQFSATDQERIDYFLHIF